MKKLKNNFNYPLLADGYSSEDISVAIKVLKSKRLTMGKMTKNFENTFKKKLGVKYAVMVNSGSSANLLAFFCITNKLRKTRLNAGDECLVPSLSWSTSVWPIIQSGLKPKFLDIDENNFCMNYETIKNNVTKKTKAIMMINVLGNCSEIDKIRSLANKKGIFLIEDNCESLGSIYKKKYLGTFGDFGTFSFYFSHQVTAGEGGMIICKSLEDYKILKCLRAHGWDRDIISKNKTNFNFVNQGFNLRPLEVSAAIGHNQFMRLDSMKKTREKNRDRIISKLKKSTLWDNQFTFFNANKNLKPSWFGLPLVINDKLKVKKKEFLNYLKNNNVETRPIISGNFKNQPAAKLFKFNINKKNSKTAQFIEDNGFFIGLPTHNMKQQNINKLVNLLLKVNNF